MTGRMGKVLYVRQLRDAKIKPLVDTFDAEVLDLYGMICGRVLARAHSKVSVDDQRPIAARAISSRCFALRKRVRTDESG